MNSSFIYIFSCTRAACVLLFWNVCMFLGKGEITVNGFFTLQRGSASGRVLDTCQRGSGFELDLPNCCC